MWAHYENGVFAAAAVPSSAALRWDAPDAAVRTSARQALQALLAQEGTAERAADTAFRRAAQLREMVGATTPVAGAALWAALSTSNFDVGRSSRDPEHSGRVQGWRIYGFWATLDWQTRIPRRSPALVHRNARFFGGIAFVVAAHARILSVHEVERALETLLSESEHPETAPAAPPPAPSLQLTGPRPNFGSKRPENYALTDSHSRRSLRSLLECSCFAFLVARYRSLLEMRFI